MTNEQHNKYIAIAFLINGGFYLLMLVFMAFALIAVFFSDETPGSPSTDGFFIAIIGILFLVYFLIALPSFIASYGLFKRKPWARTSAIIGGVVAGLNVPIGTAACIYALWFFFGDQWKSIYAASTTTYRGMEPHLSSADGSEVDVSSFRNERENSYEFRPPSDWR